MKKICFCIFNCLLFFTTLTIAQSQQVNIKTELKRLYDIGQLPDVI